MKASPPFAGFIKPKGEQNIMLMPAGTDNFEELNNVLKELYPKPEINSEPEK